MRCYSDFERWLAQGKTKRSRITRKYNYRIRIREQDGDIGVELYNTTVLTFHPDGSITLDNGNWTSASTRNVMNWFLPYPVMVFIADGMWGIRLESGSSWHDDLVYHNPVTVSYSHSKGAAQRSIWKMDKPYENFGEKYKERKQIKGRIYRYAKRYMALLQTGQLPVPSSTDCWACLQESVMIPDSGYWYSVFNDNTRKLPSQHLKEHVEDKQFVPSMLINALGQSNWSKSNIDKALTNEFGKMKHTHQIYQNLNYYLSRWLRDRILG